MRNLLKTKSNMLRSLGWFLKRKGSIFFVLVIFSASTAMAQDDRGLSVYEIPRPGYHALGIRAGGFLIKPELSLGFEHNDNIYATKDDKKSDWITYISPKIDVRSDWNSHSLGINVGLKKGIYSTETDENYLDGHIILDGRLDFLRESFLSSKVGFYRLHEERTSPDFNLDWKEPATYSHSTGDISYFQGWGKFSTSLGLYVNRLDYQNVDLKEGGSQNLNIRDYNSYRINTRLAYEMHPDAQPFLAMGYEWRRYDDNDAERDSQGYRIGMGTGFDLGGVTSGELFAGYFQQNYDQREDISGPWYGLSILWNVTRMTSLECTLIKLIKETTEFDSSGIDALNTNINVEHELLRNLLVGAFFDYTYDSYKGADISEQYYNFGPELIYLWNRNFNAEIKYTCHIKESNRPDREWTENKFMLSVTGMF